MKKRVLSLLLIVMMILSAAVVTGCGQKESVDDQFLSAMKEGLQTRWDTTDKYDKAGNGDSKEAWKSYFDAEYDKIKEFKSKKFEDKKIGSMAKRYISLIKQSEDALDYFDNEEKFDAKLDDITNQRCEIIYKLHKYKKNPLTFDDKYKDTANDMYETGKTYIDVQQLIKKADFKMTKNDYGFKTYTTTLQNTTSDDFDYFAFNINLNDKDGVTVETQTASTENWTAGSKHRFEFETDKKFDKIEVTSCSYNYD